MTEYILTKIQVEQKSKKEGWFDWIKNKQDMHAARLGYYFDLEAAERPCHFFENFLVHSKGEFANKNFELLSWQRNDLLMPLFGWMRPNGTRRYREAYVEVPKKNGKSTICSGLSLYGLLADFENGSEVYTAAVDRSQALIVFNEAANMVRASDELSELLEIRTSTKTIKFGEASLIKALSADADTKEGLNIHMLITDELHAWKNRKLFDALEYAGAARSQPLRITITTAGSDTASICYEKHMYARSIIKGEQLDPSFFGLIYCADAKDDWTDPRTWEKANPSYGITIKEEEMADVIKQAKTSAAREAAFRRYRLNQWVGADNPWMPMEDWRACQKPFDKLELEGLECWSGLDLSSTTDITALVHVFKVEEKFVVLPHFWIPEDTIKDVVRRGIAPYDDWVRKGWLSATPGNVISDDWIIEQIKLDAQLYDIKVIHFDAWGSSKIYNTLEEFELPLIAFRQGYKSFNSPTKELEKIVRSHKLQVNNPVLDWMAANVVVETDPAGNIKPTKKSRDRGRDKKIDGIVALIMALDGAINEIGEESFYETGDIAII